MKKNILILAALLGAFIWTGCQPLDDEQTLSERQPQTGSFTLCVNATKGADTKALTVTGTNLKPHWDGTETVCVYKKGVDTPIGTMTVTPQGNSTYKTSAKLSGTITCDLRVNDELTLVILPGGAWNYTGQTGNPSSLSDYDYATARVIVKAIEGTQVSTVADATFVNEQSVYRFQFTNGYTFSVKEFTVASDHNALAQTRSWNGSGWTSRYGYLTVQPASATNEYLYLAIRNENTTEDDILSFYVINSANILFTGNRTVSSAKLGNGRYLSTSSSVSLSEFTLYPRTSEVAEVW